MLTRVFVLGFALLMAMPASATVEQCKTSTEILKLQEGLLANARVSSLRVKLVDCLRALRGAQLDADALADSADDKSKVPSKGSDKTLDGRVKLLESLAKEDYQRLLETEDLLRKTRANGVDETKAQAEVQKSRTTLETVVRLVDEKPDLVPNLFIAHRSDKEANDNKTKAKATEDAAELACSSEEGTNGQVLTPKLTDLAGVQRCVDVLTGLLNANAIALGSVGADSSDAAALTDRSNALTAKLDYVRERGIAIALEKQKTSADLQGKIDAEKDDAKKKQLQADLKVVQDDITVLNAIAVEPGLRRRCLRYRDVRSDDLNDAAGVERCVNTLTDAISDAKIAVASPDVKAATDRVRSLEALDTCIASMDQRKASSCDVPPVLRISCGVMLVNSVPEACRPDLNKQLVVDKNDLLHRNREANAALKLQKELEQRLHEVQAAGNGVSIRKTRESGRLDQAIADESDAAKKKVLADQQAKVKAEILLLAVIAVNPDAETRCGDENAHLDIDNSAIYITRCIHALTAKVRETRLETGPDRRRNIWFLSRICGLSLAEEDRQVCDIARLRSLDRCESRTLFS